MIGLAAVEEEDLRLGEGMAMFPNQAPLPFL